MKTKKPKPIKKMSELQLQKLIVEWLNLQGHFVWRTNAGTMFIQGKKGMRCFRCGFKGLADINGVLRDGRFIGIECKIGYQKITKEQRAFLEEIRNRGGVGLVARSLEDVIGFTKQI